MKVTVDDRVYDFQADEITNVEGMAIERVTGQTYKDWAASLKAGSMLGLTALVWTLRKREEPALRFDDVVFTKVNVETDDAGPKEDEASTPTG